MTDALIIPSLVDPQAIRQRLAEALARCEREHLLPDFLIAAGYISEDVAADVLDLSTKALVGYRKRGIGPQHARVGRKIIYSVDGLLGWLAAGGLREAA